MRSTWAPFTCSLVLLVVTGGVCCIKVVDAPSEEAVSLSDDMTHSQPSSASLQSTEHREPPANGCTTGGDEASRSSQQTTTRPTTFILHPATTSTESNRVKNRDDDVDNDKVDFDDTKSSSDSDEKSGENDEHKNSDDDVDNDKVDFDDTKSSSDSDEKSGESDNYKNNHNDMKKRRKTNEKSSEDIRSDGDDNDNANDDDDAAAYDGDNDKKKNKVHPEQSCSSGVVWDGRSGQRTRETCGVTSAVLITVGVMLTLTAVLVFFYCYFTHRRDRIFKHRSHGSACNTYSLQPVGSRPRPPESLPVATPLGMASSRQTISTENIYELVDETHSHREWVPVKKPRNKGVGCEQNTQYTFLKLRASKSDGGDGVCAVNDRITENHVYTHLHQPGDSHNALEHESKSAPDVVRLLRRRMNCKSLEPLPSGSPASTGDTSDSSSSVDTPGSVVYSFQNPIMEVYSRATVDTAVMAPADHGTYMSPVADTAVMDLAADTAVTAPADDGAYMIPVANTAVMAPADDTAVMTPAYDTAVMAPADDGAYMIPVANTAVMAPSDDTAVMAPSDDTAVMAPSDDTAVMAPEINRAGADMDAAVEVYRAKAAAVNNSLL